MSTTTPATPEASAAPAIDAEIEAKLERFLVLKELASEFEKLKKELKPVFQGTEHIEIGTFEVTGDWRSQPEKTVKAFTYWDMRVKRKLDYSLAIGSEAAEKTA